LRDRIAALRDALSRHLSATILERATAVGIFEGLLVPVVGDDLLHLVHPLRIVVASGAVERHAVFPGNDLPGVLLGRGASRLAGVHGLPRAAQSSSPRARWRGLQHLDVLRRHAGDQRDTAVVAAVVPAALASRVPAGIEVNADGTVVEALGSGALHSVVIEAAGGRRTVPCDTLVLSTGLEPRDGLLRQAMLESVRGAGDVTHPGCSEEEAEASGRQTADAASTADWNVTNGCHRRRLTGAGVHLSL
jgi:NADPH-dependent 2,4-dienoyl-CoA reductase/sulfur reductase-like enzyme